MCNNCDNVFLDGLSRVPVELLNEYIAEAFLKLNLTDKTRYIVLMGLAFDGKEFLPEADIIRDQFPQFQTPEIEQELKEITNISEMINAGEIPAAENASVEFRDDMSYN